MYGCSGRSNTSAGRAVLDALTAVHDQDVVGQLRHHAEVVRDDDERRVELRLQVPHQVEDLRLHGHVEGGGRLVRDQQLGVARQRHRDHRALPHAAGELVRVVVDPPLRPRDADPAEHVDRVPAGHRLVHLVVYPVGLDDLLADRVVRVHRRQRILEDHRHLLAAQRPHGLRRRTDDLHAVEPDLARHVGVAPVVQPQDAQAGHRLAGAGLADDAQGAAALEGERDRVHRANQAVVGREVDPQVA